MCFNEVQLVCTIHLLYSISFGDELIYMQQEEDGKETTKVLHHYTADKLSSFGELALM
jgi:hypothetical protein